MVAPPSQDQQGVEYGGVLKPITYLPPPSHIPPLPTAGATTPWWGSKQALERCWLLSGFEKRLSGLACPPLLLTEVIMQLLGEALALLSGRVHVHGDQGGLASSPGKSG